MEHYSRVMGDNDGADIDSVIPLVASQDEKYSSSFDESCMGNEQSGGDTFLVLTHRLDIDDHRDSTTCRMRANSGLFQRMNLSDESDSQESLAHERRRRRMGRKSSPVELDENRYRFLPIDRDEEVSASCGDDNGIHIPYYDVIRPQVLKSRPANKKRKWSNVMSVVVRATYVLAIVSFVFQTALIWSTLSSSSVVVSNEGSKSSPSPVIQVPADSEMEMNGSHNTVTGSTEEKVNYHGKENKLTSKQKQLVAVIAASARKPSGGAPQLPKTTKALIKQAKKEKLAPLGALDREKYTIRMNTWKRNEQLVASINHHARCDGVAQIQVVWCDKDEQPPEEIINHHSGKVVVEHHEENSLNERYNIQEPTPTVGVLSLDDDVLRPCAALDAGFFKWTKAPERLVGYDFRIHAEHEKGWKYGGLSLTEASNRYSMVLLRSAFIHRDYLNLYMKYLPRSMFDFVSNQFNCEDIAMSLFVTTMTNGKIPLLADRWAIRTMTKLHSNSMISTKKGHKSTRDECLETFSRELGLHEGKGKLGSERLFHGHKSDIFEVGASVGGNKHDNGGPDVMVTERERKLQEMLSSWKVENYKANMKPLMYETILEAKKKGLIAHTSEWTKRWGIKQKKKKKR